jgi:hypothetical protein
MKNIIITVTGLMLNIFICSGQVDTIANNNSMPVEQTADTGVKATSRPALTFNPDIGVIGDFRGSYISRGEKNYDLYLEETELSLRSVVDPYIRADFFLSFGRDAETLEYGAEVEEAYLTTLSLPARLQLRAGKFRQTVGRINSVHPHALPFADLPVAYQNYFGDEGLNDEGISASWLLLRVRYTRNLYSK